MPKALQNEICRADMKKNNSSLLANCKKPQLSKVAKTLVDKATKKKSAGLGAAKATTVTAPTTTTKPTKILAADKGHEKKVKVARKNAAHAVPIKTRSGVSLKDANVSAVRMKEKAKVSTVDSKLKNKEDKSGRTKQREVVNTKKVANANVSLAAVSKKETKKSKNDSSRNANSTERSENAKSEAEIVPVSVQPAPSSTTLLKKETKKRGSKDQGQITDTKKMSKMVKKTEEVVMGAELSFKKESQKSNGTGGAEEGCQKKETKLAIKSEDSLTKLSMEMKKMDERCMAPKKRIKHKCARESLANMVDVKKETVEEKEIPIDLSVTTNHDTKKSHNLVKNIKFFKSKSKKLEKSKEPSTPGLKRKDGDMKLAFAVYDNIDDDSEECNKNMKKKNNVTTSSTKNKVEKIGKETEIKIKQHLEAFKKSKTKSKVKGGDEKSEKRKLDSDSEVEGQVKYKKLKRSIVEDEEDNKKEGGGGGGGGGGGVDDDDDDEDDDDDVSDVRSFVKETKVTKQNKKTPAGKVHEANAIKVEDGSSSSSSLSSQLSDNAPLNRLIVMKKTKAVGSTKNSLKREARADDSEVDSKNKKVKTKTPAKKTKSKACKSALASAEKSNKNANKVQHKEEAKLTSSSYSNVLKKSTPPKKSVRFNKQVMSKVIAKPTRRRRQRIASLNALAMVHCMYENESKSISVSSFDSTENSDDNVVIAAAVKKTISTTLASTTPTATTTTTLTTPTSNTKLNQLKEDLKDMTLIKFVQQPENIDPVINRESLRTAPGLRSVGKHWDMNSSSISSILSDENNEIVAPVAAAPVAPIVIKEIVTIEKPKNTLKKKFARSLRRHVSEDSSEEDKHQALLHEEKQRMIRRRKRQKKEMTMDLKDMVVCKRMASLNATAILAASYSSTTGKRTITVKSAAKSEEKRENVENFEKTESLMTKIKGRKQLPFIRKKFSSSSDADVEDEADVSGSEVVVKTASSSGKQQVSLIVNQDSGVTITGLYLNSTTKSTHHQGYCSISGMQYRISSTSHTQTEATTVTTEAIVRTPQEPLRPPITVSLHPDRQLSPPHNVALSSNHPPPVKTYTPLGALSSMQPPGSPHHMHHLHHHPKAVTISSTQEISSLERHGCPSAFSAPTVYGPPPPPSLSGVTTRPQYPILSKTPPEPGFVAGYYQPAGPLISHHHHHHHHHHHVQTNSTTTTSTAGAPSATATSTSSTGSTISFAKVSQSPLVQPPTPPASNVAQPVSEVSDNEMASATTPAAEITVSESAPEESNYPMNYRFSASTNPPFRSPSHNYQSYYPSPPSTASLSHPQQQAHFQEILYSSNPPTGPPGAYHLGYLPPKGPPYHPQLQRRYIPALPPQQYFHPEYPSSASISQQQVVVPAHPLTATTDSYHSAPPTPSIIESYPHPAPIYYSGYSSAPPTPYYPYATSSRSLTLVETSCPCPLQGCQKNVDTGPLTGFVSKGPVEQRNTPLSPVALSLPKEPQDIRSLPSPARGSAGSQPTPSPAIATARNPSSWNEGSDCGYDTAGLLTISKGTAGDSGGDLDSGIDGTDIVDIKTKRKYNRREMKKMKIRKIKTCKQRMKHCCKGDGENHFNEVPPSLYDEFSNAADTVGLITTGSVAGFVSRLKPAVLEVCENIEMCENLEERIDELVARKRQNYKRWCQAEDDDCHSDEREMPKLYPEVGIEYENRCFNLELANEEPLKKKSKVEIYHDDKDVSSKPDVLRSSVDVEKNNYLSALQLCSVTDLEHKYEQKMLNGTLATAVADSFAPLRRHEEPNIKISSKCKDEAHSHLSNPKHVETETNTDIMTNTRSSECATNDVSVRCCRTVNTEIKRPRLRRRRWTNKKKNKKKSNKSIKGSEEEKIEAEKAEKRRRAELLSLSQKRAASRLKWSNGWMWLGEPFVTKVFMNTEGPEVLRTCYHAMKHQAGDIIRSKDCILLRSGSKKTDLPYIAKVAHLWEDPEDGEMMMSLFWYYRPEHTEHDAINSESPYELYASKHKDVNSVACIEDKCYVLTFNEYCRYHKSIRQTEESVDVSSVIVPPLAKKRYPRQPFLPPENTPLDLVYFCRKIYDFRQHRLLKNPFFV